MSDDPIAEALYGSDWPEDQRGDSWEEPRPSTNGVGAKAKKPKPPPAAAVLQNFRDQELDGKTVRVGLAPPAVKKRLLEQTKGWPKRVREMLFAQSIDYRPVWLLSTDALFAWIGDQLKAADSAHPVAWVGGADKVTEGQFFQHLVQTVEDFDAVEPWPHWPALPKTFYMHEPLRGGDGKALAWLLERFQPATDVDADLIKAMFLTTVWGGAPGTRPAFLIESEEEDQEGGRGAGKTKLAQACAHVVGGHIDARPGEEIGQFITRLLSPQARQWRVALLDNIKALRFSDAAIEALLTSDTISGRQLYLGDGQRPNTMMWIFTLNGAALSKDLAQRCVIVRVKRGDRSPLWEPETWEFIGKNRLAIIGDLVAELRRPGQELRRYSRWAPWERAVLSHVAEPSDCQKVIEERQGAVDGDQAEMELVRQAFVEELRRRGHSPDRDAVFVPSKDAAEIVNEATGEKRAIGKAVAFLFTLKVPEVRKSKKDGTMRGAAWRGLDSDPSESLSMIHEKNGTPRAW